MMIIKGTFEGVHPSAEQARAHPGGDGGESAVDRDLAAGAAGCHRRDAGRCDHRPRGFGNAVVIAGNYPLLATSAWFMLDGLADIKGASVIVAILLVPTVALFIASRVLTSRRSFVTVTGRGSSMDQIATPAPIKWAVIAICSIVSIFVVLLYLGIFLAGLTNTWGSDWSLSFLHWQDALKHWDEMWFSLEVSFFAGLLTACFGQIAAFLMSRELPMPRRGRFLAVLPGALPGVFVGIGYVLAFNAPPIELAGSMWMVVFALAFWHLPLAYQATSATLSQIHKSIEDAARDLGAKELRLIWDIFQHAPAFAQSGRLVPAILYPLHQQHQRRGVSGCAGQRRRHLHHSSDDRRWRLGRRRSV